MSKIKILPEILTNKIAAGEVVERPVSVVKELVENSIDAKSTNIIIEIKSGGKNLIRISDNGEGMKKDDALLATERYATSKIKTDDDIFAIASLGFRGEAIPSIASVSKFTIMSKDKNSESGVKIYIEGGKIKKVLDIGIPQGTTISVENLFYNVPARKKFLKSQNTEIGHIVEFINAMAIFWNDIQLKLIHNNKIIYSLQKKKSFERFCDVLGKNIEKDILKIDFCEQDFEISGWCSSPNISYSNTKKIYIYINGRFVRDRIIQKAIFEAYRPRMVKGRFPMLALFLKIPLIK